MPAGITVEQRDATLVALRETDKHAALHGLTRALLNNAVEGVTKGWTRELEIVGIGYRAELKGKALVVFSLGYSHPIEYPLPTGIEAAVPVTRRPTDDEVRLIEALDPKGLREREVIA